MKKIISFIAITALLFACSKTDITPTEASEAVATEKAKGGNGGGGNGGGGNGGGGGGGPTTDEASYILPFGATSGGDVSGNVIERGVCYNITGTPTITDSIVPSGSGSGTFTSILSWLDDNTTYYVRAYATKKKGTTYGNEVSFTTPIAIYGTIDDIDGNTYTTIEIGTQVWMMENLKTTKYRDGTSIPNVTDDVLWAGLSSGAYCDYNNVAAKADIYGRLYNGYAVDDSRNIAPAGWHVATGDEVQALLDYVGGTEEWGRKLKEAGTVHWNSPNMGADNSSAFTALPGGFRMEYGSTGTFQFNYLRNQGRWWASDPSGGGNLDYFYMWNSATNVLGSLTVEVYPPWQYKPFDKSNGYSVRCVKD